MNAFLSLATQWATGNLWLVLTMGIVGIGVLYLLGTYAMGHALYWNKWNRGLFSSFPKIPRKHVPTQAGVGSRKLLIRQIPLFLQTLSNAIKAGYSLEQAFVFIAQESDPPIRSAVQVLNEKIQLHVPIENALQDFAEMVHHPDIDFFVESTILQLRTGGNLVKLFQKVAELVEEKRKLARDIKSFTSQGKMSGILIAVLYPVSLILFALLAPSHVETLFYTTSGQCLLVLSLILELIGFACIWKIIRVKI